MTPDLAPALHQGPRASEGYTRGPLVVSFAAHAASPPVAPQWARSQLTPPSPLAAGPWAHCAAQMHVPDQKCPQH